MKKVLMILALTIIGGLSVATLALTGGLSVTTADEDENEFKYQYAAKFVCGRDPQPAFVRVVPGFYAASVAIHNPHNKSIDLRKKVALTFPPSAQRAGAVSQFINDDLGPDEALQADCQEIFGKDSPHPKRLNKDRSTL